MLYSSVHYLVMASDPQPPKEDARITRSRTAAIEAARALFLAQGYAATTMDEIAARAGLSKTTLYNLALGKEALLRRIVADVTGRAEAFARTVPEVFAGCGRAGDLPVRLGSLAQRLAATALRPDVVALRRLLIRESAAFPDFAAAYFERAPGQVLAHLAAGFEQLAHRGLLRRCPDPARAAEHFAYLVLGAPLDRAVLTGVEADPAAVAAHAVDGVTAFLAAYGP